MTPPQGVGQFLHLECNRQHDADKKLQDMTVIRPVQCTLPQSLVTRCKTLKRAVTPLGVGQWHQITDEVVGTPRMSQTT